MENKPLLPGIYFNLPSEIYHKDPALSRSNLLQLLDTPETFWKNSWMNPDRTERKKTDPMIYGSAFDCLLFEPSQFKHKYQIVPIDVWDAAKIKILNKQYEKIIESIRVLRKSKESTRWLSGGVPKVTVVFDWLGFRFRCEFDYFMTNLITDYKAVHSLADFHIRKSFWEYGLDIQMALYKKARTRFKEQFKEGEAHVYGDVNPDFFKKFIASEMDEFIFIAQRESEPYPFRTLFMEDDTEENGIKRIGQALEIYVSNLKQFGTAIKWPVCSGKAEVFSMFHGRNI